MSLHSSHFDFLKQSDSQLTIASKVSDGQRPGQLQLVVVRWYPGQDPLEDAALSSLKQLLHGLVCTKMGNKKKGGRNRAAVSTVTVGLLMCGKTAESQDHAWSSRDVRAKLNESRDQELVPFPAFELGSVVSSQRLLFLSPT